MDYVPLRWVINLAHLTSQLTSSSLRLMWFDFKIVNTAGINYQAVDKVSKLSANSSGRTFLAYDTPVVNVSWSNKQGLVCTKIDRRDSSLAEMKSSFGNAPPTLLEFLKSQRSEKYGRQDHKYMGLPKTAFTHDKAEIFGINSTSLRRNLRRGHHVVTHKCIQSCPVPPALRPSHTTDGGWIPTVYCMTLLNKSPIGTIW